MRNFVGVFRLVQFLAFSALLPACGGGGGGAIPASPPVGRFAYVANFADGTISIFRTQVTSGELLPVGCLATVPNPIKLLVHPTHPFLFVAQNLGSGLVAYTFDPATGFIQDDFRGSPYATGLIPYDAAMDPQGRFLYVANSGTSDITGYRIDTAARDLVPIPGLPIGTGITPHSLTVDPTGRFLYTANYAGGDVTGFSINQTTGALTVVPGVSFGAGSNPECVVVDPSGQNLYVTLATGSGIAGFRIDPSTGALTVLPGSPFSSPQNPAGAAFDPTGTYLCVASANILTPHFRNPETGALSGGTGYVTGGLARNLAFDPTGRYVTSVNHSNNEVRVFRFNPSTGLMSEAQRTRNRGNSFSVAYTRGVDPVKPKARFAYVAAGTDNAVSGFSVDAGSLAPIPGSPYATTANYAYHVAVDPRGKVAVASNGNGDSLTSFLIDPSTGALTPAAGAPFATGAAPREVAVDPAGRFVYVANANGGSISGYALDIESGALTPVAGSPFAAGTIPIGLSMHYTGRFLYAVNFSSNNVSGYAIETTTGALTALPGSPFACGNGPLSIACNPAGPYLYVANSGSNTLSGFFIDSDGSLNPLIPRAVGTDPAAVAVHPTGRLVFVANRGGSSISVFRENVGAGMSPAVGSPFAAAAGIRSLSVDPAGLVLYAANSVNVRAYSIDVETGTLSALGLPVTAGAVPVGVTVVGTTE